jgi:Ycf4.
LKKYFKFKPNVNEITYLVLKENVLPTNKLDKKKRELEIFRWGFPGKNREINFKYPFDDIDLIKVEIIEGINPKRTIYIKLKNKSEIPLNSSQLFLSINELEKKTTQLAEILQVSIEGL